MPQSRTGCTANRTVFEADPAESTLAYHRLSDELQNLLSGSRLHQRRLLNLLRWLGNELQIPLIAAGTPEALHAIQSDDQLANRFEPVRLPPWRNGEEYRQLLSTLEALLPLRRRRIAV